MYNKYFMVDTVCMYKFECRSEDLKSSDRIKRSVDPIASQAKLA